MNPIQALHNAARDHCHKRATLWMTQYSRLIAENRDRVALPNGDRTRSPEAIDTYSRYGFLTAILHEIERFIPDDFRSFEECRGFLARAAETAQISVIDPDDAPEAAAISDEHNVFTKFITPLRLEEAESIPMLPFRQVLEKAVHIRHLRAFASRWGDWYGGAVKRPPPPADAVTLHVAAMDAHNAYDCLRKALAEHGLNRVLELRESGDGYETDTKGARFTYTADGEGFWTSGEMEWMVYASHESSITFGGAWLIDAMRKCLPDFDRWLYRGYDLAAYET